MMRRRGMPLVRTVATTAVIAGTAGAVHHHQDQRYAQKDYEKQQQYAAQQATVDQQMQMAQQQAYTQGLADAQAQQQMAAPPPQAALPAPSNDLTSQLQQLAQLHNAGVLDDAEFAAAKQKLLGG
jgi:hypothetical protein